MQLRKVCNHPYLLEYPLIPETQQYRIDEEIVSSCGKFLVLDRMLPALKKKQHKVSAYHQDVRGLDYNHPVSSLPIPLSNWVMGSRGGSRNFQ